MLLILLMLELLFLLFFFVIFVPADATANIRVMTDRCRVLVVAMLVILEFVMTTGIVAISFFFYFRGVHSALV